jgi:hypothetical protein
MGTRLAVSLPRRNVVKGRIGMIKICMMSSAEEMHETRLTTGARSMSVSSKNDVMKGIMTIMVPSVTNLTDSTPQNEGAS